MNKAQLIEKVAHSSGISKNAAEKAIHVATDSIKSALKKGEQVAIVGFGTFRVTTRAARTGRNPRTGAPMKIRSAKVPRFTAGKSLKDALR